MKNSQNGKNFVPENLVYNSIMKQKRATYAAFLIKT